MTEHSSDRTAVYGPVCTVVWEGMGRKAHPYPDPAVHRWEQVFQGHTESWKDG